MAFSDNSKLNVAFKKLVGKAQTDNLKEMANEAKASGVTVAASTIFGENLPLEPTIDNLYDISNSPVTEVQAVEFLRLELVADPSSNGHAFFARLPSDYEANSSNEKVGEGFFVNQQQLVETAGKLQIVPPLFGLRYEAKPYSGGTSAKGSGSLIPPGDIRDWYFDYFNGVFFQQTAGGSAPSYIECLVYVGNFADEGLRTGGTTGSVQFKGIDGFLAGGNNFKWGENSINLNGLKITAMEGPATLLDNQTVSQTIFSYNAAENKACLVEYLLERDGETQLGKLNIINNGSTVAMTGDYVSTDNLGVTFSAEISGSDVLVEYTSTNTGQDASFKFCRRRWS